MGVSWRASYRNTCFRCSSGAEGGSQPAGFLGNLEKARTMVAYSG